MEGSLHRIVFVILHYLTYAETVRSANTILTSFSDNDVEIVIVDNASPNGSGQELHDHYQGNPKVHVLPQQENLGYAKGNNVGYRYAIDHLNPSFIVFLNNDVLISQPGFLDLVDRIYEQTGFAVLGPDVYVPSLKWHQSPKRLNSISSLEAYDERTRLQKLMRFGIGQQLRLLLKKASSSNRLYLDCGAGVLGHGVVNTGGPSYMEPVSSSRVSLSNREKWR